MSTVTNDIDNFVPAMTIDSIEPKVTKALAASREVLPPISSGLQSATSDITIVDIVEGEEEKAPASAATEPIPATTTSAEATPVTPAGAKVEEEPPVVKHSIGQVESDLLLFVNNLAQDDFITVSRVLLSIIGYYLPTDVVTGLGFDCNQVMLLSNAENDMFNAIPTAEIEKGLDKELPGWKEKVSTATTTTTTAAAPPATAAAAAAIATSDDTDTTVKRDKIAVSTREFLLALGLIQEAAAEEGEEGATSVPDKSQTVVSEIPLTIEALALTLCDIVENRQYIIKGIRSPYDAELVAKQLAAQKKRERGMQDALKLAKKTTGAGGVLDLEMDEKTGMSRVVESKCSNNYRKKNKKMFNQIKRLEQDLEFDNTKAALEHSKLFQQMLFRAANRTWRFDAEEKGKSMTEKVMSLDALREFLLLPENLPFVVSPPLSYLSRLYSMYMIVAFELRNMIEANYEDVKAAKGSNSDVSHEKRQLFLQAWSTLTNLRIALQLIRYVLAPASLCHYIWMKNQGEDEHKILIEKCFLPERDVTRVDYGPQKMEDGVVAFNNADIDEFFTGFAYVKSKWILAIIPGLPQEYLSIALDTPLSKFPAIYRDLENRLSIEVDKADLVSPSAATTGNVQQPVQRGRRANRRG